MPLPARGVLAPSVWYMSRSAPSRADQALIAHAASYGRHATARQLERWRTQGLLPPNIRSYPGRGAGSASQPASGAGDLVVWLTEHARRGRRPGDLALFAFGAGLAVPEATVRAAFADAVNRDRLGVEHDLPHDSDPEDVAATVATGVRGTILPARMRALTRRWPTQVWAGRPPSWPLTTLAACPNRSRAPTGPTPRCTPRYPAAARLTSTRWAPRHGPCCRPGRSRPSPPGWKPLARQRRRGRVPAQQ